MNKPPTKTMVTTAFAFAGVVLAALAGRTLGTAYGNMRDRHDEAALNWGRMSGGNTSGGARS